MFPLLLKKLVLLTVLLTLSACAGKKVAETPAPAPEPAPVVDTRSEPVPAPVVEVQSEPVARPAAAILTTLDGRQLEIVYFAYDSFTLETSARQALERNAAWLKANAAVSITIEGHCDERGSDEYNLALGDRRAQAVKNYLTSLGIAGERLATISYGEERPAVVGHDESAWGKNRRAEFK